MRIKAITIENFKSIGDPVRIEFKPLTLLFGPNSAGKSSIIQALHYIREVLEFRRLDVDKTISGGEFIDLGGFENFVHGHDPNNKVSFEIELHDVNHGKYSTEYLNHPPTVPEKGQPEPLIKRIQDKGASRFKFTVGKDNKEVYINSYSLNYNDLVAVEQFRNGDRTEKIWLADEENISKKINIFKQFIEDKYTSLFDKDHILATLIDQYVKTEIICIDKLKEASLYFHYSVDIQSLLEESRNNLSKKIDEFNNLDRDGVLSYFLEDRRRYVTNNVQNMLPRYGDQPLFKEWWKRELEEEYFEWAMDFAERSIIGTIVDELRDMLYVGPLRTIPPRNYSPQKTFATSRWSDGLAAWDKATYADEATIEEANKWLGDERLATGYALKPKGTITIEQDDLRLIEKAKSLQKKELVDLLTRFNAEKRKKVALVQKKDGLEVSLCDVGVGISQTFPVVMAALDKEAKVVIIEQPELHIHPRLQVELGDLFISAAQEGKCIIVETHSEHLILRLLRRIRETVDNELPINAMPFAADKLAILYVQPSNNGSEVVEITVNSEGEFTRLWPEGFFTERARELY